MNCRNEKKNIKLTIERDLWIQYKKMYNIITFPICVPIRDVPTNFFVELYSFLFKTVFIYLLYCESKNYNGDAHKDGFPE